MIMQLRNLVWATSKHDVYLMSQFSVTHWSSLTSTRSEVLNVSGHVAPSEVNNVTYSNNSVFFPSECHWLLIVHCVNL